MARLRAPAIAALMVAFGGCENSSSPSPETAATIDVPATGAAGAATADTTILQVDAPSLASSSYTGGIPIGIFHQPNTAFGSRYNGAMRNDWPQYLLSNLADIKSRGGKVILMFAGNEKYYKDGSGHFSLSMWKQRIDRYRGTNFLSYVTDGTIIGHYLIDEPNDPANWNGQPVSPATVESMAQYSKQIWPSMTTLVRAEPGYFGNSHPYLDAAWAQYTVRKGDPTDYVRRVVSDAQDRGLALVVGLNLIAGGTNRTKLTATQVAQIGSALLSSTYPCAFISWQYDSNYLSASTMQNAMDQLRSKAENRSTKSCKGA